MADSAYIDQYNIETTWSKRQGVRIVKEELEGNISITNARAVKRALGRCIQDFDTIDQAYDLFMFLLFSEDRDMPIQSIAMQLGMLCTTDKVKAFSKGIYIVKMCAELTDLYHLDSRKEGEDLAWYVCPNFKLDKITRKRVKELQFLPPMKVIPRDWNSNTDGGWVHENQHIMLGKSIGKHNKYQAYDVINKLQKVPFEIDVDTYMFEKKTNHNMKKKPYLKVLNKYLGEEFYFVWRYDTRGRSYSSGYHLNIQSDEYSKALLSFANKEMITNIDNLYIAIAGHAGKDKLTWTERIKWAKSITDFSTVEWEEPILGRKAVRALNDALQSKKSGYMMSADATSSGIQIMAALSGCLDTAKFTNMIDPTTRVDVYSEMVKAMNDKLDTKVNRKTLKKCLMTYCYNSKATPKKLLSEEQLEEFYDSLDGLLSGAQDVLETINSAWDDTATEHSWTMPDGHKVIVPVIEYHDMVLEDEDLGDIPFRYYSKTPSDNYRSLGANICHSVDAYIAREMVRRCEFQLVHIHDAYLFSPDHLQDVANMYRTIVAEIADMDLLQHILREITGDSNYTYSKYTDDLSSKILQSEYMLS
ncbi:MAG: DNA-directed RNA polymerase [Nanoarchaeota archaeon]|nr:DNA-directed RNA polymerase [Nanoarchaeota archaeon]